MRKSINRTTVILVLAIFLTLSVGYALFSDTITIEGTATAQGKFDIEATCMNNVTTDMLYEFGFVDGSKEETSVAEQFKNHGYKDETCVVSNDKVTYSVGLEYPTATKKQWIKMKNNGNVPAYFDLMNVFEQVVFSQNNIIKKYDSENNLLETINETDVPFIALYVEYMVGQSVEGIYYNLLEDEELFYATFGYVNEETEEYKVILKPGESLYMPIFAEWAEAFNENNVKYEATGIFEFDWQQYTE